MGPLRKLLDMLSSMGLASALLLNLFLLTWFGTLHQVEAGLYQAQKLYFESWYVVQSSPVPLVLPGGLTTMGLLAINLLLGGLWRIQKSARTAGVIVIHVGIALLLASGFVKLYHSDDGHLTLMEPARDARGNIVEAGETSDEFVSYHQLEVAIWDASQRTNVVEHLIPHEQLIDLAGAKTRTFSMPALPFELELTGYLENARPMPKGPNWQASSPVVDGYALLAMDEDPENERNTPALTARFRETATGRTSEALLAVLERFPATFEAGGKTWAASLRRKRYPMPFAIRLEDFRKDDHPGMSMARSYESDVTQIVDGREEPVRIQMNEPLRAGGLVLFQSSWWPQEGPQTRVHSVFSVVRNPSDHWPLYACIVIGIGLLMAFTPRLAKFARQQREARARKEVTA